MGRALDNAMLNVGLKEVARGMQSHKEFRSLADSFQTDLRTWASELKTLSPRNMMLLWAMAV